MTVACSSPCGNSALHPCAASGNRQDDTIGFPCSTVNMSAAGCLLCRKAVLASAASTQIAKPPQTFTPVWRPHARHTHRHSNSNCVQNQVWQASACLASRLCVAETAEQPLRTVEETGAPIWDVVGLGQPMVDFSASVDDDLLVRLGIVKGSRR